MNNTSIYYMGKATQVIHENITEKLKSKYDLKKIRLIVELEDDYFDVIGLNVYPAQNSVSDNQVVDQNEIGLYIINRAAEIGLLIEQDEIQEILTAELIYLKSLGAIDIDQVG